MAIEEHVIYMPTSVMPKGVEHTIDEYSFWTGANAHLCDAERR